MGTEQNGLQTGRNPSQHEIRWRLRDMSEPNRLAV